MGGQRNAPAALPPVPIVQETGWAPALFWTGAENLVPTGIRSPDRPARSESLYQLSSPDPQQDRHKNDQWQSRHSRLFNVQWDEMSPGQIPGNIGIR